MKKIAMGFATMLGLVVLISAVASLVIRDLTGDLNRAANLTARAQYLAGRVSRDTAQMGGLESGGMLAAVLGNKEQSDRNAEGFRQRSESLQSALAELIRIAEASEDSTLLARLQSETQQVNQAHQELRQATINQQMDTALLIFGQKVQPLLDQVGSEGASLVEQQNRELSAASAAAADKSSRTRLIMIMLALTGFAAGAAVYWLVHQGSVALKRFSERMAASAEQVAGAASQVSGASHSLAEGASAQASSLEETSASTEEIVSITRANAERARQVAELMQQSAQNAAEVDETLDRTIEKMKEIDASSTKIAHIIKVIDGIAFQTNILALNAAVEAARAGEAGLGFAVVADEVRNLAQRSAQAAKDTAGLIEESIQTSRDGNARLDKMAHAVRALTENSSRVKTLVDEVNRGNHEQAHGMEQIAHAVLAMERVTQKNASSAQESASAGTELDRHAASLHDLVEEMREMMGAGR
jgi:methyl-accepting chemotaxis protein/methyl-accepting chemotaxis protein-1 (serine sensor receptor)